MIRCPKCGSSMSTQDSRVGDKFVRRRGACNDIKCDHRVTTIEVAVGDGRRLPDAVVVSRSALAGAVIALANAAADSLGRDVTLALLAEAIPEPEPEPVEDED